MTVAEGAPLVFAAKLEALAGMGMQDHKDLLDRLGQLANQVRPESRAAWAPRARTRVLADQARKESVGSQDRLDFMD